MDFQVPVELLEKCFPETAWKKPDSVIVDTPDLYRVTTLSAPFLYTNGVYRSIFEPKDSEPRVEEIVRDYAEKRLPMRWIVLPSTQPKELELQLQKQGLRRTVDLEALFVPLNELSIETSEEITVEELTKENIEDYLLANGEGWGHSPELISEARKDVLRDFACTPERSFLARYKGEPAGTGAFRIIGNSGYLKSSCVRPKFRGTGVYRSLVKHRAEILSRAGRVFAVTHARSQTSAPICKKLGFRFAFMSFQYESRQSH